VTEASLKVDHLSLTRSRFLRGGALPVAGHAHAERIAQYLLARSDEYSMKIVTQDWHLDPVSIGRATRTSLDLASALAADTSAHDSCSLAEQSWDVVIPRVSTKGPTRASTV